MRAVVAAVLASGFGTQLDNDWPPARYQGVGKVVVTYVRTQGEIDRLCGKAPDGFVRLACSRSDGITLPDPCRFTNETFAKTVCHENAHFLGNWPGSHPQ